MFPPSADAHRLVAVERSDVLRRTALGRAERRDPEKAAGPAPRRGHLVVAECRRARTAVGPAAR